MDGEGGPCLLNREPKTSTDSLRFDMHDDAHSPGGVLTLIASNRKPRDDDDDSRQQTHSLLGPQRFFEDASVRFVAHRTALYLEPFHLRALPAPYTFNLPLSHISAARSPAGFLHPNPVSFASFLSADRGRLMQDLKLRFVLTSSAEFHAFTAGLVNGLI